MSTLGNARIATFPRFHLVRGVQEMKSPNPSVRVISRALAFIATLMLCFGASLASAGSVGLDFQKSFAAPTIPLNGTTTLTFSIQNTDEFDDSEDFTVEDTLPAGLSVSNPGGTVPMTTTILKIQDCSLTFAGQPKSMLSMVPILTNAC